MPVRARGVPTSTPERRALCSRDAQQGLVRFAQDGVPGFKGPFVGKKAAKPKKKFQVHTVEAPKVILGGGRGGAYIPQVGGRGM